MATKFFEHFIYIANAFYNAGQHGFALWDESDGFFYDALHLPDKRSTPLKVRSFVGLIPLFAVEILRADTLERLPVIDDTSGEQAFRLTDIQILKAE